MITLPKSDKARTRRLETGEEQRLLIGANDQLQRIITLALETGMRRGEILNIKKSHIDLTIRTLFIPSTKTNEPRTVPTFKCSDSVSYRASESLSEAIPRGNFSP